MRSTSLPVSILSLLSCHALVGCIDGAAPEEAALADPVEALARPATIHISSPFPPALVAFRDATHGGRWQRATRLTPSSFEARVHGPYVVSVVCVDHPIFVDLDETITWQVGRTPEDSRELTFCDVLPTQHTVTGHMVQPGLVQMGDSNDRSTVPDWDFTLPVPAGTFDLIATSADAIAFRRGIPVAGDLALAPAIDMAQEGTGLVDVAFTAANATPDEATQVSVGLFTATSTFIPVRIFLGALDAAKAAPATALLPTDTQSVSVRGIGGLGGTGFRALRRPFQVGGDASFTLPPPLAGVRWTVARGELALHWAALPEFTLFSGFVGGNATGGLTPVDYLVDLSPRFLAATRIHDFTIDTDLPGFRPAWKIDFTQFYNRDLTVQNLPEDGVVVTSEVTEFVEPTQPSQLQRAQAAGGRSAPLRHAVEP